MKKRILKVLLFLGLLILANIKQSHGMEEYTLETIVVTPLKPQKSLNYDGYELLESNNNDILLLAAYINTQIKGEGDPKHIVMSKKFGIAQCILNRCRYKGISIKQHLITKSSTIKNRKSNYFLLNTEDYSYEAYIAAHYTLKGYIPSVFNYRDVYFFYVPGSANYGKDVIREFDDIIFLNSKYNL